MRKPCRNRFKIKASPYTQKSNLLHSRSSMYNFIVSGYKFTIPRINIQLKSYTARSIMFQAPQNLSFKSIWYTPFA